jgi:hypothetical protein
MTTTTTNTTGSTSSGGRAGPGTVIAFTGRGHDALDRLAATLVAGCDSRNPDQVAGLLDQVLHAPLDELAAALAPIPPAQTRPPGVRLDGTGRARTPGQTR